MGGPAATKSRPHRRQGVVGQGPGPDQIPDRICDLAVEHAVGLRVGLGPNPVGDAAHKQSLIAVQSLQDRLV